MPLTQRPRLFQHARLLALGVVLGLATSAQAQTAHPAAPHAPTQNHNRSVNTKPTWQELSASQQQALSPLAQLWPSMSEAHKRKWIALSQNFTTLAEADKNTLQSRMREWAALTPQQRTQARLNFADAKQLPQDERRSKWEAYQALSAEEKQKFAAQKPVAKVGGAPAIKPVAPEKLTTPPAASNNKALPRIASDKASPTTLLPNTAAAPTNATSTVPEADSATSEQ